MPKEILVRKLTPKALQRYSIAFIGNARHREEAESKFHLVFTSGQTEPL